MKALMIIFIPLAAIVTTGCEIMPRNTLKDCRAQCRESKKAKACYNFCNCIHEEGKPLNNCLDAYDKPVEDTIQKQ